MSVKEKFDVWPECVRYWMNPELREATKAKHSSRYKKIKKDPALQARNRLYRQYRKETGISREKYHEWLSKQTPEKLEQRVQSIKQHRLDNLAHYKKKAKARDKAYRLSGKSREKYRTNREYRLKCNIREHVRAAMKYARGDGKKYNKQWFDMRHPGLKFLGCTVEEFIVYIESKFRDGMTWENHGRGEDCWHLDHIRPLAHLKDINDEAFIKQLCHYTNYQPLWEKENLSKQDKWEEKELVENKSDD